MLLLGSIILLIYIDAISALFFTFFISVSFLLKKNITTFFLISIVIFVILIFNAENFLNIFGRDFTLTGRTIIWQAFLTQDLNISLLGRGIYSYVSEGIIVIDNSYIVLLAENGLIFSAFYWMWITNLSFRNFSISQNIEHYIIYIIVLLYSVVEIVGVFYYQNILLLVMFITYFRYSIDEKNPKIS